MAVTCNIRSSTRVTPDVPGGASVLADDHFASGGGTLPGAAIDGNVGTRWQSGQTQLGLDWFEVDFKISTAISQVTLFTSTTNDWPRYYEIRLSDTSQNDVAPILAEGVGSVSIT